MVSDLISAYIQSPLANESEVDVFATPNVCLSLFCSSEVKHLARGKQHGGIVSSSEGWLDVNIGFRKLRSKFDQTRAAKER